MDTIDVELPAELKTFVDSEAGVRGFATGSEYIGSLIRREHERQELRAKILEGLASEPAGAADETYFASLREQLHRTEKG